MIKAKIDKDGVKISVKGSSAEIIEEMVCMIYEIADNLATESGTDKNKIIKFINVGLSALNG